ncbi:dynamin family protein [Nonomuraea sp. PA05]|uniref:dynamin family protein n=1 Tax=Nonomuraea sp. PA05 TaxID=2604466 RepID=UPI0016520961|nr:dynamin family protein [Nonomuraea sp. PA05]
MNLLRDDDLGPLSQRLLGLCDRLLGSLTQPDQRATVTGVRDRLCEPLRVAIGGREKAGKSTLVNALLGRRVAPTAVGTCTKVVTWYRYHHHEHVDVQPYEGQAIVLPLRGGRLPAAEEIGLEHPSISHMTVYLSHERLRSVTIVDTPGLESSDARLSARTHQLLALDGASTRAISQADALIYLFQQPRSDDMLRLEDFRDALAGMSALNALGVLSRVDTLAGHVPDPWPDARRIATKYGHRFRMLVADVLPVVGLLGEAAGAGLLTERDADDLRALAALTAGTRRRLLLSADLFVREDAAPVPAARRRHLLSLLGLYGLRQALGQIDSGTGSAAQLVRALHELSGVREVDTFIGRSLTRRADPMKAVTAIRALESLAYGDLPGLRGELERIRLAPDMHQLEEMDAMRLIATGTARLPAELEEDALRVMTGTDPAARLGLPAGGGAQSMREAARAGANRWQATENRPGISRAAARVARTVKLSYLHLYAQAGAHGQPEEAIPCRS